MDALKRTQGQADRPAYLHDRGGSKASSFPSHWLNVMELGQGHPAAVWIDSQCSHPSRRASVLRSAGTGWGCSRTRKPKCTPRVSHKLDEFSLADGKVSLASRAARAMGRLSDIRLRQ